MHPLEGAYLDTAEKHRAETKGKLDTMNSTQQAVTVTEFHALAEGALKYWISETGTGFIQDTAGVLDSFAVIDGKRAYRLSVMPADNVQEYLADGFTYEEVCAELNRRRVEEIAEAEAESAAEAEEIAEEIAPAPSVIAMDTVPQDSVTLTLNGKTEDISSLHGVARTAAEILLSAGLNYRAAREAVREVIEGCINADELIPVTVRTANGPLSFIACYSN